ncbi:MAG TPA: rhodanese-like domain-containing protein [Acidimicrobiia bacterium]|nr:rhodanese-like domain-containing protein [Acidimicrobiia bacterium]
MTYAGDVDPTTTYAALSEDPTSVLVDVRTNAELAYVGYPELSTIGKSLIAIEWQQFPTGAQNAGFVEQLDAHGIDRDAPIYFICRSGARSRFAAMVATSVGYGRAYNVAHGFEGPPDAHGHRGSVAGWKASGLPWRQS